MNDWKNENIHYSATTVAPFTIIPFWTVTGDAHAGVLSPGVVLLCNPATSNTRCVGIQWPWDKSSTDREGGIQRAVWHGTLLESKRDKSGLGYMRNRYVDPATGRFTQEDPIGLAGGINLYGFANGDPVNFNDPFGLCPPADNNKDDCQNDDNGNHKASYCPSGTAGTPPNCHSLATGAAAAGSCPNVSADEWDAGQQAISLTGTSGMEEAFWFTDKGGARRAAGPAWVATPGTGTAGSPCLGPFLS
jgi:RHS repeat-associated protein